MTAANGPVLDGMLHAGGDPPFAVRVSPAGARLAVRSDSDIFGVPIALLRRDDREGCRLRRTDRADWWVTLAEVPAGSWPCHLRRWRAPRPWRRGVAVAAMLVLLLGAGLWWRRDAVVAAAAPLLPHHVTDPIGRGYLAEMGGACTVPAGRAALDRLTVRLAAVQPLPEPLKVTVVDTPEVNAVALPGGHVALFRGFLDQAGSADEVAAALAHEIAHVVHQHPNQALLLNSGPAVLARVLGSDAGKVADLTLIKQGSKASEAEADGGAIAALRAAAISTRGGADYFRRKGAAGDAFATSHPSAASRAARYGDAVTGGTTPALGDADWQALKNICRR